PVVEEKKGKKAKETPEQRAARLERQRKRKTEVEAVVVEEDRISAVPAPARAAAVVPSPAVDGWEVVTDKRKLKTKKTKDAKSPATDVAAVSTEGAPTAVDQSTGTLKVEAKKVGVLIGPKGATMHAIQDATDTKITMPKTDRDSTAPATVSVVGTVEGVAKAISIMRELCNKGYSASLEGEGFQEFLPDIIGKNGTSIRALQDKLSVRVSIPPNAGKDGKTNVRIGLAGERDNIAQAKEVIREIMTYFHSPLLHPGIVHTGLALPTRMYNQIIGAKGSEIRHIQNNFKVSVHIPNAESALQEVLVVGEKSGVDSAVRYIEKIVAQITAEESAVADVNDSWSDQKSADGASEGQEADEPWMKDYMYNREAAKNVSLLAGTKEAQADAWKQSTDAEGW
ncbi:SCP160, partial [Symbiodinium microadriaticum]